MLLVKVVDLVGVLSDGTAEALLDGTVGEGESRSSGKGVDLVLATVGIPPLVSNGGASIAGGELPRSTSGVL